jgi:hypothetical protein
MSMAQQNILGYAHSYFLQQMIGIYNLLWCKYLSSTRSKEQIKD